jgi:plastocyanin
MRSGRLIAAGGITLVTMALASACSSDDNGTGPQLCTPTGAQVCMNAASFNPANLTVTAGSTVLWIDGSGLQHTVTSAAGSAETFNQAVAPGATFSHQFNAAGTFNYYCTIHGSPTSGMRGTITVN